MISEFRKMAFLNNLPQMEPIQGKDWDAEPIPQEYRHMVPATTNSQRAAFKACCEMSTLCKSSGISIEI